MVHGLWLAWQDLAAVCTELAGQWVLFQLMAFLQRSQLRPLY